MEGTSLYFQTIRSIRIAAAVDDDNDLALGFCIGVTRYNRENREHENNTRFPSLSYLSIGATTSKCNVGHEFIFSNNKYD